MATQPSPANPAQPSPASPSQPSQTTFGAVCSQPSPASQPIPASKPAQPANSVNQPSPGLRVGCWILIVIHHICVMHACRLKDSLSHMALCQPCGPPTNGSQHHRPQQVKELTGDRLQIQRENGIPRPEPDAEGEWRQCDCTVIAGQRCMMRAVFGRTSCSRCTMIYDLYTGEPLFSYECNCACINCDTWSDLSSTEESSSTSRSRTPPPRGGENSAPETSTEASAS